MSARIRIALPLVQSAVAAALITANRMRADSLMSPSWNKPEIQICYGLNAPAALVVHVLREAAYLSVPNPHQIELVIDTVIYVALVWITWFVVGVEIDGNGRRALVARPRLRITTDLAAMAAGLSIGVVGLLVRHQFGGVTLYSNLLSVPYFVWCGAGLGFYGNDLRQILQHRSASPNT